MLVRFASVFTLAAMATCSPCGSDYANTSQGATIWPSGERLQAYTCVQPPRAAAEVDLALSAVLFAFDRLGILTYSNCLLEGLQLADSPIYVCFVEGNALGNAGLMQAKGIWISLGDGDGNPLPIEQTALAHELIHEIVWRACLLLDCETDRDHADPRLWGADGVEGLAKLIVSAFR